MSFLKSVLSIVLLQFSFHVAEAAPLPAYSVIGDLLFNLSPPNRLFPNDFGSFALTDPRFGSVSVNSVGTPAPFVAVSANIGPNTIPSIFGRGSEIVEYALEIIGPTSFVPVRIDVAGAASGFATSGASFAVESRWDLLDGGSPLVGDDIRSGQLTGSFDESFSRSVDILLTANHVYSVFMLADAAGAATLEGPEQLPMQLSIQYSRLDWVSILSSIPLLSVKGSGILVLFQNRGHSPSYSDVSFPLASWFETRTNTRADAREM